MHNVDFKGNSTVSWEATVRTVFPPFWMGVYSKRKEFAPKGRKFFPFRIDPISEIRCAGKQKGQSEKLSPLWKLEEKLLSVSSPLKDLQPPKWTSCSFCKKEVCNDMPHVCIFFIQVHKKLGNTHLALMNFSWAMDLDPKGINNQIKEAIDKRYVTEEDDSLVHFNEPGELQNYHKPKFTQKDH